jgi:hypothetical protein
MHLISLAPVLSATLDRFLLYHFGAPYFAFSMISTTRQRLSLKADGSPSRAPSRRCALVVLVVRFQTMVRPIIFILFMRHAVFEVITMVLSILSDTNLGGRGFYGKSFLFTHFHLPPQCSSCFSRSRS